MGEADTAIPVDATTAVVTNQPRVEQSLSAKFAQAGRAWERSAPTLEPEIEAKRFRHVLQFAADTGMHEYGRAYNVDDVKAEINEIAENMDWEKLVPEVLADETITHDYRLAKILLKNAHGYMNDDDYPGYSSRSDLVAGIAEVKTLLAAFQKQPQAA